MCMYVAPPQPRFALVMQKLCMYAYKHMFMYVANMCHIACMYTCLFIYACVRACVYIYIYIYIQIHTYIHTHIYTYKSMRPGTVTW